MFIELEEHTRAINIDTISYMYRYISSTDRNNPYKLNIILTNGNSYIFSYNNLKERDDVYHDIIDEMNKK